MEYWIWLTLLKGIGPIIAKRLIKEFKTPKYIYNAKAEELINVLGIGNKIAMEIINNRSLEEAQRTLEASYKQNIKILTYNDPFYGDLTNKYPEMPVLLYYKGNIKEKSGVAVVGSRRCTSYGKNVVVEAAEYLAKNEIPVISGMAKGIDGYAHTACLNAKGYTIAFLGNGLDICYPKEHNKLMESIIENGAVISEYPLGVKARPEHFPRRNNLICCWSEKVLVVEASRESGALITANIAKSQNKKVLSVPSDIYSITGEGTNRLILEGAEIYLSPSQLLVYGYENLDKLGNNKSLSKLNEFELAGFDNSDKYEIKANSDAKEQSRRNLNEIEIKIISCLKDKVKTIDEISKSIGMNPLKFIEYLTILELEGTIKSVHGGRYTLK